MSLGSVAATDNDSTDDLISPNLNDSSDFKSSTPVTNTSSTITSKETTTTKVTSTPKVTHTHHNTGCCSVIVHIKDGYDVFAYRRDSSYAANLYIKKIRWYGKETIKEYKKRNGYFFHTIVTKNGWIIGTGGPDVVWINKAMEKIAGQMTVKGRITRTGMNRAYRLLRKLRMGHFLIKAPNGYVGIAVYNSGSSKVRIYKMRNREYITLPNSPRYYRRGFIKKTSNPVNAAIYLAGRDRWGINRRNIITYQVIDNSTSTKIKIYATYDNGRLVGRRSRGRPDNIILLGRKVSARTIPRIPYKKYLGTITIKKYNTISLTTNSAIAVKT